MKTKCILLTNILFIIYYYWGKSFIIIVDKSTGYNLAYNLGSYAYVEWVEPNYI